MDDGVRPDKWMKPHDTEQQKQVLDSIVQALNDPDNIDAKVLGKARLSYLTVFAALNFVETGAEGSKKKNVLDTLIKWVMRSSKCTASLLIIFASANQTQHPS